MDFEQRLTLVNKSPTEEIITSSDLIRLLETTPHPKHYIGLEISGQLHLGSLIITGLKINDLIKAQFNTTVFLADWHTFINNKMDKNWQKIKELSLYYKDAFSFFCPGVNIVLGTELYEENDDYWKNFMLFCKHLTLARTMRSLTIMGRNEKDSLDFSQFLYPAMQANDIHTLDLDLVHSGMDQRKIHMLVREIFPKLGWKVPVCLHHHLLLGLLEPTRLGLTEDVTEDYSISSKMSKSKPMGGIFIHDDENTIKKKITKAYCPEGISTNNPVLDLAKYLVFPYFNEFTLERPSKYGGNVIFTSFSDLEKEYVFKKIHPQDLKTSISIHINKILEPVRDHLKNKFPFDISHDF